MYRLAIIRSASSAVSKNQYNIQEIGLAKELAKAGMSVDVFLISDKDKGYSEVMGAGNRVTIYWLKGIKIPGQQGYYKDLLRILDQHSYHLIQALDDSQITTVLVSRYCRKKHIKFVLWQGMYEDYSERYKKIIQFFYDWTLLNELRKNTNYAIAKTTSAAAYLKRKQFVDAAVIPVGLETANFRSGPEIDYRKEFNLAEEKKILLYVGKVEDRRKPFFCLDVFQKLRERDSNWCLIYVGRGPLLEKTHQYVRDRQIHDVIFRNQVPQNQLAPLYRTSDLFILPTRYEIFGMVLMEAMYFASPVITYQAAGPKDVIENGADGIILDNFDVNQWVDAIEAVGMQQGRLRSMGRLAAEKIRKNYLWDSVAKHYYEEYVRIIEDLSQ